MNSPTQIRTLFQILKSASGSKYKDHQLLQYANSLFELFDDDFDDGYQYKPSFDDPSIRDVYYAMSMSRYEMFNQEKELLKSVYESESDDFLTSKSWKSPFNFVGAMNEC
ncbi:hypothetical protein SAMN06295945_1939 [Polynucleobacter meluiroseus]|jgi:hypothetical protein|uniref:Uncharacterized protein n=1 Tax=Polynucleobacter meluiroseus TaxID=1938814 RepID=A0A240E2B0_9BURK|nr:hypothetical protein [Polynucleobacter meluiroseus]SNX29559.1 hypothetical protein SAMN06295945_1939 [Polynucleobacter meluiroseus]